MRFESSKTKTTSFFGMSATTLPATLRNISEEARSYLHSCKKLKPRILYYLQVFGSVLKRTAFSDRHISFIIQLYEVIVVQIYGLCYPV